MSRNIRMLALVAIAMLAGQALRAQVSTAVAARLGFPQTIFYNGKIVSMNDQSFESKIGDVAQAMAVRDNIILAMGTNASVRELAGPNTKQIDLKGRTMIPSLIMTHEHPTDWVFIEPRAYKHVFPDDSEIVSRWMPSIPAKEQLLQFEIGRAHV